MSDDENENEESTAPVLGVVEPPTPVEETGEAKRLVRPTMLQVEGVVYCLDHTVVHDDTENPYGEGPESWCRKDEHRTVYYRGRKGDIDERVGDAPPPRRAITLGHNEGLTPEEKELVVERVALLHQQAVEVTDSLCRILGEDSPALDDVREKLDLASSVLGKLRGE